MLNSELDEGTRLPQEIITYEHGVILHPMFKFISMRQDQAADTFLQG